jgi:hypothetical protein
MLDRILPLSFALALATGCAKPASYPHAPPVEWIEVSPDGRGFVASGSRAPWIPWGFNYDHDDSTPNRLLEDYWEAEWPRVERDFATMRELGATLVRVPLQLARFMRGPTDIDQRSLERLRRLVALAEANGIHLDLTGLANYRPNEVPSWYSTLGESERWSVQVRFWEAVSTAVASSPAVFCFNLMNEPAVPGEDHATWFPPPWINGWTYVEYIAREPRARARDQIARRWLRALSAAIRRHDGRHLITVGTFTVFDQADHLPIGLTPSQLAGEVDFLALHLYPHRDRLATASAIVRRMLVGKPLVIEESGPVSCSVAELRGVMSEFREHGVGWLGFYWGGNVEAMRRSKSLADALTAEWLDLIRAMSPAKQ